MIIIFSNLYTIKKRELTYSDKSGRLVNEPKHGLLTEKRGGLKNGFGDERFNVRGVEVQRIEGSQRVA
jgi:hypothetical protein